MLYYTRSEAKRVVGAGWSPLIDEVYDKLATLNEPILISTVKEKFGGLRIYFEGENEELLKFLWDIETKSFTICEVCGEPGRPRTETYWIRTVCDAHNKR